MRSAFIPLALTFALAAIFPLATRGQASTWLEVRTEHFTVFTSAGESAGRATADRLEALHRALSRMAGTPREATVPTKVFVFADDDELQPFKPAMAAGRRGSGRAVAGGFFAPRELTNFVVANARTAQPISSTIQHELLHQFATQNLPRLPFWFNEGLAEYYSTFEVQGGIGIIGRPHRANLRLLASSPTGAISGRAMARATELRASKELYDDAEEAREAYALSWALVHYLLSDDDHAESTLEFMRGLARGQPPTDAFADAFGRVPSAFAGSVARYLVNGRFPEFEIDLSRIPRPRIRILPPAERDLAMLELALAVSKPRLAADLLERAWTEVERDGAAAPDLRAGLWVAEGRIRLLSEDFEGARFALLEATRIDRDRVDAHLYLARTWLGLAAHLPSDDPGRRPLLTHARDSASRAADAAPRLVPALDTLANTWIVEAEHVQPADWPPADLARGLRALETALEEDRYRADLATKLALLHALGEDLEAALDALRRHRIRYDEVSDWDAAVRQTAQIEIRLISMRTARAPSDDEELDRLDERIDGFLEFTHEFDAISNFFAEARALEEELEAQRARQVDRDRGRP